MYSSLCAAFMKERCCIDCETVDAHIVAQNSTHVIKMSMNVMHLIFRGLLLYSKM